MIHERETEFRRLKFAQIWAAAPPDASAPKPPLAVEEAPRRSDILEVVDEFRSTLDVEAFRQRLHGYSTQAAFKGAFAGFNFGVAMFLNQMVKRSEPSELATLLVASMEVPNGEQAADDRVATLVAQVEQVKVGAHPAPKSAGIFCSFFWWLQEPEVWPFMRPGCEEALRGLGWLPNDLDSVSHYRQYRALIRSLAKDPEALGMPAAGSVGEYTGIAAVDTALIWFSDHQWIGLDTSLADRLRWASELNDRRVEGEYPDDLMEVARTNVAAALAEMRILGDHCETPVSNALGREMRRHVANEYWMKQPPVIRANAWVKWKTRNTAGWNDVCNLVVTVTPDGVGLGVSAGRREAGWAASVRDELVQLLPADLELIDNWAEPFRRDAAPTGNDYLLGARVPLDEALGNPELADEVERIAAALQPVFDRVMSLVGSDDTSTTTVERPDNESLETDPANEDVQPADEGAELEERLDAVVDECHLDGRAFVDDMVELLRDKRQIVLYGPPGTGKTYIARKLAEALAPSAERRRFVQFHPSTSYEDFFEGYRPTTDAGGKLSYALEPGPFASLVEQAAVDFDRRHILVIDELNRANVPKVFGELLFLLEYRNERVVPLYRPEGFSVPENIWVIATMNTADRSIAMLDAALRRRFHFVPVFPDNEPISGVLERYLRREGSDVSWARLLEMVNTDLRERLGNGDQLIGPSHFMRPDPDETHMKRIWEYNIEPLIDDLFYGDNEAIRSFKWVQVLKRFKDSPAGGADPAPTV